MCLVSICWRSRHPVTSHRSKPLLHLMLETCVTPGYTGKQILKPFHFFYTCMLARIKECRNTHAQSTNTLWKNQQTQMWWLETKNTAKKQMGRWREMMGKKIWAETPGKSVGGEPHRFQIVPRRSQAQGEGEQHANPKRLCSIPPLWLSIDAEFLSRRKSIKWSP